MPFAPTEPLLPATVALIVVVPAGVGVFGTVTVYWPQPIDWFGWFELTVTAPCAKPGAAVAVVGFTRIGAPTAAAAGGVPPGFRPMTCTDAGAPTRTAVVEPAPAIAPDAVAEVQPEMTVPVTGLLVATRPTDGPVTTPAVWPGTNCVVPVDDSATAYCVVPTPVENTAVFWLLFRGPWYVQPAGAVHVPLEL